MEEFIRDYKAEWQKEKEAKTSRLLKIDKKLKADNVTYSQFVHTCIYKYLNGERFIL